DGRIDAGAGIAERPCDGVAHPLAQGREQVDAHRPRGMPHRPAVVHRSAPVAARDASDRPLPAEARGVRQRARLTTSPSPHLPAASRSAQPMGRYDVPARMSNDGGEAYLLCPIELEEHWVSGRWSHGEARLLLAAAVDAVARGVPALLARDPRSAG